MSLRLLVRYTAKNVTVTRRYTAKNVTVTRRYTHVMPKVECHAGMRMIPGHAHETVSCPRSTSCAKKREHMRRLGP